MTTNLGTFESDGGSYIPAPVKIMVLIIIAFLLALGGVVLEPNMLPNTIPAPPNTNLSNHAITKHGEEARTAAECFNSNGPYNGFIFQNRTQPDKFVFPCQMEDGQFAIVVMRYINRRWDNVTAYIRGNVTWSELLKDLMKQNYLYSEGYVMLCKECLVVESIPPAIDTEDMVNVVLSNMNE